MSLNKVWLGSGIVLILLSVWISHFVLYGHSLPSPGYGWDVWYGFPTFVSGWLFFFGGMFLVGFCGVTDEF